MAKSVGTMGKQALRVNGKDIFLYSGEVHYFRIPKRYWAKHLQALVDAGCNAVSTYVPWSWHEPKEGQFDITGKTHPDRDLIGFIKLIEEFGLYITLKPGPYAMAELTDQGIPLWVTEKYPDTVARHANGDPWGLSLISYSSKTLRRKCLPWLRLFTRKVLKPNLNKKKGGVIMMQLCNEIGMFQWLCATGDYSKAGRKDWQRWLKQTYPNVKKLGELIGCDISKHSDVTPPEMICDNKKDYVLYSIWHDFHRWLYFDYTKYLQDFFINEDVTVPMFSNVGGWVYGRAHEFPMNATFQREASKKLKDIVFGIDHIPELVSPNNMHDGVVANQLCSELQRNRGMLYSAELQCGSREHGVQTYPRELALFYRNCIIHGLTGMNFYMFAQGKNTKGRGFDGPMFYWYNAVDYKANRLPTYETVQDLGGWLKENGDFVCGAKRPAELGIAFYPHQHETEFTRPTFGDSKLDFEKTGLRFDPIDFRNKALHDGVLRFLVKKSVPFDYADITQRSRASLSKFKTLVVLPGDVMDAKSQEKLVEYVRQGGNLVVFPMMPKYDLQMKECLVMEKAFGLKLGEQIKGNRVYMGKLKDIPVPKIPWQVSGKGAKAICWDVNGKTIGVEKKLGKGKVRYFGFYVTYTIEEHQGLWNAMMELDDIERNAWADSDDVQVEARFNGSEGVVFAGNYHRMPVKAKVSVKAPRGDSVIKMGRVELDALQGVMLPVQTKVGDGVVLVSALGELCKRLKNKGGAKFVLRGPSGSQGYITLKGIRKINSITIDGKAVECNTARGLTSAKYIQTGKEQVVEVSF